MKRQQKVRLIKFFSDETFQATSFSKPFINPKNKFMKNFLAILSVAVICSNVANAQNPTTATTVPAPAEQRMMQQKNAMNERYKNASPEEQKRMMEYKEKMANMSPEEREKMKQMHEEKREARKERYDNASPEQKAKMDQRHEMMEKLSPQQREAVKKEIERHRAEMKRITGSEGGI